MYASENEKNVIIIIYNKNNKIFNNFNNFTISISILYQSSIEIYIALENNNIQS